MNFQTNFENLAAAHPVLLVTDIDIWEHYLAAFPDGTNPIFKTRTVHDCSCCRNFIRNVGHLRSPDGHTIWEVDAPYPFDVVYKRLHELVKQAPIVGPYGASPKHYAFGAAHTYDPVNDTTWDHFHTVVPTTHRRTPEDQGFIKTSYDVLKRGLEEINILDNLKQVIELADTNNIYRGAEHLRALRAFQQMVKEYQAAEHKIHYLWAHVNSPFARFRNTVIGSLITDLCDGVDLDRAVASFEAKVAPANYKRPKSLITPKMIDDAISQLDTLGLTSAIHRRMATVADLSVNDVLFVDNEAAPMFKDGLKDLLMTQVKPEAPDVRRATPITISELLALKPKALSLLVENRHQGNFVTLTGPKNLSLAKLFKWNNELAWSYDGNLTDSVKERVKKAGGNVTNAALRISLSWFNYDDLDLHVTEPNGTVICYYNKGGKLDVDMNAGTGKTREAVENVSFKPGQLTDGVYKVMVHSYSKRESIDVGFDLEIEINNQIYQFHEPKPVTRDQGYCLTLTIEKGKLAKIDTQLQAQDRAQEKWGISTQTFAPVDTLVLSPNHWGDQAIGNKHWFFILKNCKNPEPVRGIYNEFLASSLDPHRKVFEILGDKTKAEPTPDQLSGLGFSSTLGEEVFVQVNNATTYKVKLA